jgi:hypothetical protein
MGSMPDVQKALSAGRALLASKEILDAARLRVELSGALTALAKALRRIDELEAAKEPVPALPELIEQHGFHYLKAADDEPDGYPVCPSCLVNKGRAQKMVRGDHGRSSRCPACDRTFPVGSFGTMEDRLQRAAQAEADKAAAASRPKPAPSKWRRV